MEEVKRGIFRLFFLGFVRLNILFHASERQIWGSYLREELAKHGYDISPGTLYPILHQLEKENLLTSQPKKVGSRVVKTYRITDKGKFVLLDAQLKIKELVEEVQYE